MPGEDQTPSWDKNDGARYEFDPNNSAGVIDNATNAPVEQVSDNTQVDAVSPFADITLEEHQASTEKEKPTELPKTKTLMLKAGAEGIHKDIGKVGRLGRAQLIHVSQETSTHYIGHFDELGLGGVHFKKEDCFDTSSRTEKKAEELQATSPILSEESEAAEIKSSNLNKCIESLKNNSAQFLEKIEALKEKILLLSKNDSGQSPESIPEPYMCGYAASAITEMLRKIKDAKNLEIRTTYGYCKSTTGEVMYHFWTTVDDKKTEESYIIDATHGNFNPDYHDNILIQPTEVAKKHYGFLEYSPIEDDKYSNNTNDVADFNTRQMIIENDNNFPSRRHLMALHDNPAILQLYNDSVVELAA